MGESLGLRCGPRTFRCCCWWSCTGCIGRGLGKWRVDLHWKLFLVPCWRQQHRGTGQKIEEGGTSAIWKVRGGTDRRAGNQGQWCYAGFRRAPRPRRHRRCCRLCSLSGRQGLVKRNDGLPVPSSFSVFKFSGTPYASSAVIESFGTVSSSRCIDFVWCTFSAFHVSDLVEVTLAIFLDIGRCTPTPM